MDSKAKTAATLVAAGALGAMGAAIFWWLARGTRVIPSEDLYDYYPLTIPSCDDVLAEL